MKRFFVLATSILLCQHAYLQQPIRGMVTGYQSDSISTSYALVIGISDYANIRPLQYADDDAELFADFLIKQQICERNNIYKLIDGEATRVNIFRELKRLGQQLKVNDRIFVYFAGHGDVESDIENGYFLPYDCLANNYSATGLNLRDLEDYVNLYLKKNAKVILITDACRSGKLTGGISGASITMSSLARGFANVIKMVSCQPNQLSLEQAYPEGGHGVFTYHLVDGLTGMADNDNDSSISLREIDLYLEKVRLETNKQQTPGVEGDKEKSIVNFDRKLLLALITQKKRNESIAVAYISRYRGPGDSAWLHNDFYKSFSENIRKQRLIGDDGENAYAILEKAQKNQQPPAMISYMNLELASVLEDQAQKWINKYLRGDLSNQVAVRLSEVKVASDNLAIVEKLYGSTDIRYNDIHVKKIFFDAYYIFTSGNLPAFEATVNDLEKVHMLKPNQAWIYNLCGNFYRRLSKNAAADSAYRLAIQISPSWSYPWLGLATLNRDNLKNMAAAEPYFKKSVELNPNYVPAWNEMGKYYHYWMKKYILAEDAYKNALKADSIHYVTTWIDLGNLYYDQNRNEEAERVYRHAIKLDPIFFHAWNNLGNLLLRLKNIPECKKAYERAILLKPVNENYPDLFYTLGCLETVEGNTEKGLQLLEQAFNNGFIQFEILNADPDWNSVKDSEAFKNLVKKYRK